MACNTYERHERFWGGDMKERNHLEDLGLCGRIISKWTFKTWNGKAWTDLIQNSGKWRALENKVIKLGPS
jgi:hypothetical protein